MSGATTYRVRHHTAISYAAPVAHAQFNLRLRPIEWPGQSVHSQSLTVEPVPVSQVESYGPYPSNLTQIEFEQSLSRLEVNCQFEIAVDARPDPGAGPPLSEVRQAAMLSTDLSNLSPVPFLFASRIAAANTEIGALAKQLVAPGDGVIAAARAIAHAIHDGFTYQPGTTTSTTSPAEAFSARQGVCQDFAHILIIGLRSLGIPAAYVSGYLRTEPPPGMERLVGADAMHAWVNVWSGEELGWIGVDPTNDRLAAEDHILVGMGRDYADVSPIDGVFVGQSPQTMEVSVDVVPVGAPAG